MNHDQPGNGSRAIMTRTSAKRQPPRISPSPLSPHTNPRRSAPLVITRQGEHAREIHLEPVLTPIADEQLRNRLRQHQRLIQTIARAFKL